MSPQSGAVQMGYHLVVIQMGVLGFDEWVRADWLSFGQLVFTALGFFLALRQLKRTATAAEATNIKIDNLRSRLASNDLLVTLPLLHALEEDVDAAIKGGDSSLISQALVKYARSSNEAMAMLEAAEGDAERVLIDALGRATKAAVKARTSISKNPQTNAAEASRSARSAMTTVSVEVSGAVARLQRKASE